MSFRQGGTPPNHGVGRFDDPFMIPEPPPMGEGHSQRDSALLWLAIIVAAMVVLALLMR